MSPEPKSPTTTLTTLHKTATAFLSAFTHLSSTSHLSLRSPNCTQIFAPSSLSVPQKSNEEFAAHLESLRRVIARFPVTAKEVHINAKENETAKENDDGNDDSKGEGIGNGNGNHQITIWATGQPEFRAEVRVGAGKKEEDMEVNWQITNEYIFILDVDAETGKIVRIVEFLDSLQTERLRALVRRARENLGVGQVVGREEWG